MSSVQILSVLQGLKNSLSGNNSLCLNKQWSIQAKGCSVATRKSKEALHDTVTTNCKGAGYVQDGGGLPSA